MLTLRSSLLVSLAIAFSLVLVLAKASQATVELNPTYAGGESVMTGFIDGRPGEFEIHDSAALPSGGVVLAGTQGVSEYNWTVRFVDRRGVPDRRFGRNGFVRLPADVHSRVGGYWADKVAVQKDGKILVAGPADVTTSSDRKACRCDSPLRWGMGVIRFGRDGKLDRRYGRNGIALIRNIDDFAVRISRGYANESTVVDMRIDRRGAALVYGVSAGVRKLDADPDKPDAVLTRVNAQGRQDMRFGSNGRIVERATPFGIQPIAMNVRRDGTIVTVRQGRTGLTRAESSLSHYLYLRHYRAAGARSRGGARDRDYARVRVLGAFDEFAGEPRRLIQIEPSGRILMAARGNGELTFQAILPDGRKDRTFGDSGVLRVGIKGTSFGTPTSFAFGSATLNGDYLVTIGFERRVENPSRILVTSALLRVCPDGQPRLVGDSILDAIPVIPDLALMTDWVFPSGARSAFLVGTGLGLKPPYGSGPTVTRIELAD
jgi:hypothetical protein